MFLADTKNLPYWNKTPDQIKKYTFDALNWMFDNWSKIVILACNSASSYAIREWQTQFPEKKVLSITIPWVEEILEWWYKNIGLLATKVTCNSGIYYKKYSELCENKINFMSISCEDWVDIIESNKKVSQFDIDKYLNWFSNRIEAVVLWCTHYPLLESKIRNKLNNKVNIINPSLISAKKFKDYLKKHKNIDDNLWKSKKILYHTTWESEFFVKKIEKIFGDTVKIAQISY